MAGFMDLGKALFKIGLDAAQFVLGMKQSQQLATSGATTIQQGMNRINTSSRGAGQGLLALGQAIDDAQYGFMAIVNNIPQVVYMFGGGAGLAGVLGIAAVAANQLINHWDVLQSVFANTAPFEAARGVMFEIEEIWKKIRLAPDAGKVNILDPSWMDVFVMGARQMFGGMIKGWDAASVKAAEHKKILDAIADGMTKIKGIPGAEQEKQAAFFRDAVEASGGGEKVLKDMTDMAIKKGGVKDPKTIAALQENAARILGKGLAGKDITGQEGALTPEMNKALTPEMKKNLDMSRNAQQRDWEAQGRKNVAAFERDRAAKEKTTADRLGGGLLGLQVLGGRRIKESDVAAVMKTAGIDVSTKTGKVLPGGQQPKEVMKNLFKELDNEIKAKMAETGATREQARAMVTAEHYQKLAGAPRAPAEFVGIAEFAKKIQIGALGGPDQVLKAQLQVLQDIRTNLARRAVGLPPIAVAGGPG
jgi:hypothetical protein